MPLGKRTLNKFREHLVSWTLGQIGDEFSAVDIIPNREYDPPMSGERRRFVEQHYVSLNLENSSDEHKLLSFFENVLLESSPDSTDDLVKFLERDGYRYENNRIFQVVYDFDDLSDIAHILDASHLRQHILRIRAAVENDPSLAIGASKELIETCCKTILSEREVSFSGSSDLPQLTKAVFRELSLTSDDISDAAKGADTVKRTLSSLASVVQGIAELRNLYGSGHGRDGRWRGVKPRHAQLAVGAASTLATFLMQTHLENREEEKIRELRLDDLSGRYVTPNFQDGGTTGAEINIQELGQSKVEMQGLALWVNEATGMANTGDFHGVFTLSGDEVVVREELCNMEIVIKRGQLKVTDNYKCGGMNVTFSGSYSKIGPPKFFDT